MEGIRAWFEEQARAGRNPCRNLHIHPLGLFVCEPFRLVSTGSERPTRRVESFEAAVDLLRGRGANGGARCENRFALNKQAASREGLASSRNKSDAYSDARDKRLPLSDSQPLTSTRHWHKASNAARPEMELEPRFVTYEDAKRYLGLRSVLAVKRLVYAGQLVAVGKTSGRRVTMASLLAYAAALEEQAANAARGH